MWRTGLGVYRLATHRYGVAFIAICAWEGQQAVDTRETPPPAANNPDRENKTALSTVVNVLSIITGLVGTFFLLVTLSTPLLKVAGVVVCVAVGVLIFQVAHDRDRRMVSNRLLACLSFAGVLILT